METRDRLERGEFDHLKRGRIYKFSCDSGSKNFWSSTTSFTLFRVPFVSYENRIGFVQINQMVIYLETVRNGQGLFHKLVAGDQVGYIPCNRNDYRLKRITSRMLRRMEGRTSNEKEEVPCETKSDKI